MPDTNVRLQNLRDFTVQIRNARDEIVGTGIAVSTDGKIVTCAHVARAAGVEPRTANGAEIGVYFPQVRGGEEKKRNATVDCCFHEYDDDMVLLQLVGGAPPLSPEQIAVLGMADQSEGNPFRTYGYSPIGNYPATRGDGIILGTVEPPLDRNLQADPVQLKSRDIAAGMSGAAVLDASRNLVVGLVAERFYTNNPVQDDVGYGVDSKVLTFDPFCFVLRGDALALKPAPEFRLDKDLFKQAVEIADYAFAHRAPADKYSWNNAPTVLKEWTGRDELLKQLTADWNDPKKHVTGLIGFGGEGKSSLARKWIETLDVERSTLDGLFWWGFYENRSVDEFLEAALKYLGGGRIDPRQVPSSSTRAQIIGAMLGAGRYLFVLDGLEVMQHQEGDQYGLLTSTDLRDLLTYFARPDNQSFCLITSRAPLLDLMEYTTYTHRDVDRLLEADGIALLEKLGVKGSKEQMRRVVADWDGHALTISLLGSYLAEKHGGNIARLADIPVPTAEEPRYQRVHRVLRRYDEHLTDAEREFLKLFSAFRTPVHEDAFEKVFKPLLTSTFLQGKEEGRREKGEVTIPVMVDRLVAYRILRHDPVTKTYTAHPLVRNHYLAILTHDTGAPDTHLKIKDYYLSIAGDTPQFPTLDDLKPLIEVVHHACQAGAYDEANGIRRERITQNERRVMGHQLGAYETELSLMAEFFPNNDFYKEPQVSDAGANLWILNTVGLCLMNLGRLREAVPFYERSAKSTVEAEDWSNASIVYQNLANLYASLGALEQCAESARQALDLAIKAEKKQSEMTSLSWQGSAFHLLGKTDEAKVAFQQSEQVEKDMQHGTQFLFSYAGIRQADHLRRTGQPDYARRVTEANLQICERNHWAYAPGMCHRVLGDLDADAGNQDSTRAHYDTALKRARNESVRFALIEALLARGRWAAKYRVGVGSPDPGREDLAPTVADAFNDLNEALNYAVEGGYRIYEADIRVALGWAHLAVSSQQLAISQHPNANSQLPTAKAEAERALQMSKEMGYYWGRVDAEEVLKEIESRE